MSNVSDPRIQVRVWADTGPGHAPEQRAGVLRESLPQTAVCFSGGGTRSMAAPWGSYADWLILRLGQRLGGRAVSLRGRRG